VLKSHPAAAGLPSDKFAALHEVLDANGRDPLATTQLTAELHLQPNVLGNRAPLADPTLAGGVAGWRLRDDRNDLAVWYLAALQALAYATRHIVEAMADAGLRVQQLIACGGSATNEWWLRSHADALGIPVAVPREPEAVLLGAAMLGGTAAGAFPALSSAMTAMTHTGRTVRPDPRTRRFHDAKYRVYRRMIDDQRAYNALMSAVVSPTN
jgi:D-ribulokinase